ncbi:MAG TPA: glutathione S-transferase family protein [Gammaproteobacteria bacterium]|nr:glutathione S-transferase family protein [Gammaproteobacteria bacterium]
MTEVIVHTVPGSPFGRAALIALEEKGARYRVVPVPPGGLKAEPHLARHPFGRVPVLEHGAFSVYETQAIVRYVDRVLPGVALTPADPQAAARMDQVMNVNDWYLFQGVNNVITFQRIVVPRLLGGTPDEAAVAAAMPKAHQVLAELSRLLGREQFLAGSTFSLADVMVGAQLDGLSTVPEWAPLAAANPNMQRWLERVTARPSFAATTWERVAAMAQAA